MICPVFVSCAHLRKSPNHKQEGTFQQNTGPGNKPDLLTGGKEGGYEQDSAQSSQSK